MNHEPVLLPEVIESLNLSPGVSVIDATVGLGGHTKAILDITAPNGTVIGIDRDGRNVELAKKNLSSYGNRASFIHDSFGNLAHHGLKKVDGILFDLGFSTPHIKDAERGFSFQKDGPLDMRFDQTQSLTAEEVVNSWSRDELEELFRKLGEEPHAREIAKAIFQARKKERIVTTTQLADVVTEVVRRQGKLHPATKIFQAIRIAVNNELGEVENGLKAAVDLLKSGGRLSVISFHSLEDRLVKHFFKSRTDLIIITKKPIKASFEETKKNPKARSAKLRIAEKI